MHMLLVLIGLFGVVSGGAMLASVYADPAARFAQALITSGVIAAAGGFVVIGLGAVVSRLQRIGETLEMQPVTTTLPPAIQSQAHDAVAAAIGLAPAVPELRIEPVANAADHEDGSAPLQTKQARPALAAPAVAADAPAAESPASKSATEWPRVDASDRVAPPVVEGQRQVAEPPISNDKTNEPRTVGTQQVADGGNGADAAKPEGAPTVLKSGVIEGMAYTLYSDGSVDAELPEGTIRFASISEWRAHLRAGAK
ncbi:MAG TPA: hypothetical protein VHG27_07595 [Xanthobacteraceae bacterium]|nr:hypothetical protein [Xanthobacteraceae bacterium]